MLTISIRYPAIFIFLCPSIYVLPYKDTPNLLFESGILFFRVWRVWKAKTRSLNHSKHLSYHNLRVCETCGRQKWTFISKLAEKLIYFILPWFLKRIKPPLVWFITNCAVMNKILFCTLCVICGENYSEIMFSTKVLEKVQLIGETADYAGKSTRL